MADLIFKQGLGQSASSLARELRTAGFEFSSYSEVEGTDGNSVITFKLDDGSTAAQLLSALTVDRTVTDEHSGKTAAQLPTVEIEPSLSSTRRIEGNVAFRPTGATDSAGNAALLEMFIRNDRERWPGGYC